MSFSGMSKIGVGICLALGLVYALIYIPGWIARDTADFRGGTAEKEKANADPDYRMAQKRYFQDLCSDIEAKQSNIEQLKEAGYKEEALANEVELQEMVGDYNSASKDPNRGQYRAEGLPEHIDADEEVTCGS